MSVEVVNAISRGLALVVLYILLGFGPGFILGIMVANVTFGRREATFMQKHKQDVRDAAQHNSQWQPEHERWHQ